MATFILVDEPGKYMDDQALSTVSNYIIKGAKKTLCYNTSKESVAEDMAAVQEAFNKEDGKKLRHTIISFSKSEKPSPGTLLSIARDVCDEYKDDFQIIAGVHKKDGQDHIHFMMNSVSYKTGDRFHQNRDEFYDERKDIKNLLRSYGYKLKD